MNTLSKRAPKKKPPRRALHPAPAQAKELRGRDPNPAEEILRAESLIDCQKRVLDRIIAGADLSATLELLTSALEKNSRRKTFATVMLASDDQTFLFPIAGKSVPAEWREAIDRVPMAPNSGSCGSAAFLRERVVASDIATDPRWQGFREIALRSGLRACWSTPIVSADQSVLGTFAIYYPEPSTPSRDEIEMAEMMTRTAAAAIQKAALHQALQRELARHRQSEMNNRRLAAIVQGSDDAIISKDLNGVVQSWNRGAELIFGYSAEEIVGQSITRLIPPERLHEEDEILAQLRSGKPIDHLETVRRRKDGKLIDVAITISPIRDANGAVVGASKIARDITALRDVEMMRNRLAAIVESSDDAIIGLDLNTTITTWNRGAERTFGYTAAEAIGRSVTLLIPSGMEDEEPRMMQRLLQGERIEHYETVRRRKDGSLLDVSLTVSAIRNADGTIVGASKISRDITEARRQQLALKQREEELRAMANSIPQLAWMARPDGYIYWYNQRWFDYTGTTLPQMEGWGWQAVHDPHYLKAVADYWKDCLSRGVPFEMEFPLRGADGVFRWFLTRVSPFRDETGKIIRWFGTNTEVDELRRAQQALKEETHTLEVLNDTGKIIASELELEKIVQTVTDSATKLSGAQFGAFFYSRVNDQGESFQLFTLSGAPREAFEHFGHPRATPLFAPIFKGGPPICCDDVLKDSRYGQCAPSHGMPAGHPPVRSYLAVPVVSRSGKVFGGLFFGHPNVGVFTQRAEKLVSGMAAQAAIAMDNAALFSELREAREQLTRHNQRLEDEVAGRTAALRETIQQLEAFSYSVSHDMRSPLRAMQGYADALLADYRESLDPTAAHYLTRIHRAATRMDLLIQDVLAYSRVAKSEIQLAPVNVEAVIADVIQTYPSLHSEKANISVAGPIPPVIGHEAYITQIVSNYLTNAVKFVQPGVFPFIQISARDEGPMVRIGFRDNGIGITPQQQKQLFQIFGRIHSEKRFEGTGIGLAIAKKAAERMGGSVGVVSEWGQGSEFFVVLRKA